MSVGDLKGLDIRDCDHAHASLRKATLGMVNIDEGHPVHVGTFTLVKNYFSVFLS